MSIKKACFITPENDVYIKNYQEIESFCKNICLKEENIEKFNQFKKDYSYFTPYFDFVMFELKYIFVNCLLNKKTGIFNFDDALYLYHINSFDYKTCLKEAKELYDTYSSYPFMTKLSDQELTIKEAKPNDTGDNLIDPNLYQMMSKSGTIEGSHGVTANSILNHLLTKSEIFVDYYDEFINTEGIDQSIDPINFLINNVGFFRATGIDLTPMIITNQEILTSKQKDFINEALDYNYQIYDIEQEKPKSYIKEYKKTIKEDK